MSTKAIEEPEYCRRCRSRLNGPLGRRHYEDCPLVCEECGNDEEGLELREYEDEGDPSVGYGPITVVMCQQCAERKGLVE